MSRRLGRSGSFGCVRRGFRRGVFGVFDLFGRDGFGRRRQALHGDFVLVHAERAVAVAKVNGAAAKAGAATSSRAAKKNVRIEMFLSGCVRWFSIG